MKDAETTEMSSASDESMTEKTLQECATYGNIESLKSSIGRRVAALTGTSRSEGVVLLFMFTVESDTDRWR